jgi:hypothetical protein
MAKATDRGQSRAIDRAQTLSSKKIHPTTGVVTVSGRLTRPGLLPYAAHESPLGKNTIVYRSPAAVFAKDYVDSVKGSLISPDHKFLDKTDDHGGLVSDARVEGGYVAIDLMFTSQHALDRVLAGSTEVSAGYTYDYVPMNGSAISAAKLEYPEDWAEIQRSLPSFADRALWISGSNLRNNHVTPVTRGRAGSASSLDEGITMDEVTGLPIETTGVLEGSAPIDGAAMTSMIEELLGMVLKLQASAVDAGLTFDGLAFARDRAGYLEGLLGTIGVQAKDATLSMASDLITAYGKGYLAGKAAAIDTETAATATDVAPNTVTIAPAIDSDDEAVKPTKAWDKLTRTISTPA